MPFGLHEVEASRISRQLAHKGGKVVSPIHWPPLPPRRYPWYTFLLEAESTLGFSKESCAECYSLFVVECL